MNEYSLQEMVIVSDLWKLIDDKGLRSFLSQSSNGVNYIGVDVDGTDLAWNTNCIYLEARIVQIGDNPWIVNASIDLYDWKGHLNRLDNDLRKKRPHCAYYYPNSYYYGGPNNAGYTGDTDEVLNILWNIVNNQPLPLSPIYISIIVSSNGSAGWEKLPSDINPLSLWRNIWKCQNF